MLSMIIKEMKRKSNIAFPKQIKELGR
jgi:hypothetical protein